MTTETKNGERAESFLERFTRLNENPLPAWASKKMLKARRQKLIILQELASEEHAASLAANSGASHAE